MKECRSKYRFDTPNRPVAIARYLFNTYKETFLHPTVTSTFDMRTGKVVARDGKMLKKWQIGGERLSE